MSEINLTIGDTSVLDVTVYRNDEPLDLKDYLVLFTVKKPFFGSIGVSNPDDQKAVLAKNSDIDSSGGIEKYGIGNVRIILGSLDTKNIIDGAYDYDLQISKPGEQDTVITVDSGTINFSKEITTRNAPL
jgi:hypothetical protein